MAVAKYLMVDEINRVKMTKRDRPHQLVFLSQAPLEIEYYSRGEYENAGLSRIP